MKIKSLGANVTELHLNNGTIVLFSYEVPVAAQVTGRGFLRTEKMFSPTTTRHINKWLDGVHAKTVSQDEIERLLP